MKKFAISTSAGARVVNANEYSVSPKLGAFEAQVKGGIEKAWSTAGKGKSQIPNYYLYFREQGTLYYFRSNPEEIAAARTGHFRVEEESMIEALTPAPLAPPEAPADDTNLGIDAVVEKPAPKRMRRRVTDKA